MKKLGILIFGIALVLGVVVTNILSVGNAAGQMFHFNFSLKGVKGSGNIVTEERDISDFRGIDIDGVYQVEVTAGREFSVTVEADDNILPLIRTEVDDGILKIESKRSISPNSTIRVRISAPDIDRLEVSGVANVNLSGVSNSELAIISSGASKVALSGTTARLSVEVSGATRIDAAELAAESASVDASGASNVSISVLQELEARASGASHITYAGSPTRVRKDTSGVSSVTQR